MGVSLLILIGGFLILTVGAEALVRGSSSLALRLGVTPLMIGLTIVAFGTSSPELAVSVKAALDGNGSIALGNVIGSNIANIGLILGIASMIQPIKIEAQVIRREIPIMIVISLLLWVLLLDGTLQFLDGLLLLGGIFLYLGLSYHLAKNEENPVVTLEYEEGIPKSKGPIGLSVVLVLLGLGMLIAGGILFVDGAVDIAVFSGISPAIIGLTIVAVGTSMPELATSVVASLKKEGDIAIGNAVGSNIFNILGILGVASTIRPISGTDFSKVDLGVMLAYGIFLLPLAWTGMTLDRKEGFGLLLGYLGYLVYLVYYATSSVA